MKDDTTEQDFRILALDGGGIRGVFTARYLSELEQHVRRPLIDHFNLIVGTSTGGIIAIALGLGIPSRVILDMYKSHGSDLFPNRIWRKVRALLTAKHDVSRLHIALRGIFGERKLGDSKVPLCIPVVDESNGKIKVLKTDHHPHLFTDYRRPAWEVAAATAAAPFYYRSFLAGGKSSLLDGGIWANNPSLIGLCEAIRMFGRLPSEVSILSIGTGQDLVGTPKLKPSSIGLLRLFKVKEFMRLTFAAQAQAVERMVEYLGPKVLERIQPMLPHSIELDDARMIPYLEGLAEQTAQETLGRVTQEFFSSSVVPFIAPHKRKEIVQ